jgi:transcriptional regulator of arginine metabolism
MYDRPLVVSKEERLALILRLVRGGKARTQAEFLRGLRARGERVDQSTLSRDLAELGIRKAGGRYVVPERAEDSRPPTLTDFAGVVKRFTTCGPHLTVVTTVVGQAQAVAVAMDTAADPAIVATLAGDDTVFVATRNRRTQAVALRRLKQWFGDKHEL